MSRVKTALRVSSWESMVDMSAAMPAAVTMAGHEVPAERVHHQGQDPVGLFARQSGNREVPQHAHRDRRQEDQHADQGVEQHHAGDRPFASGGEEALEELREHRVAEKPQRHVAEPDPRGVGAQSRRAARRAPASAAMTFWLAAANPPCWPAMMAGRATSRTSMKEPLEQVGPGHGPHAAAEGVEHDDGRHQDAAGKIGQADQLLAGRSRPPWAGARGRGW